MNNQDNQFDLSIKHYNLRELEEILELPPSYDASIVEMKETKLRQNIMSDQSVDTQTKMKTVGFLSDAKKKIITALQTKTGPVGPTSVEPTPRIEKTGVIQGASEGGTIKDPNPHTDDMDSSIIQHKVDPYILSNPSKYFKGQYNPLNKRIIKKSLNIDTRFRENYFQTTPSNFQIDLPMKFNNVVSMQLASMELPTSFYNIDHALGNNFFALIDPIHNITQMIIVPDGNYTYADLINEVNTLIQGTSMTRVDPTGATVTVSFKDVVFTLDIYLQSGSGRVIVGLAKCNSYTIPDLNACNFILSFQTDREGKPDMITPLPLKFGWMLGFRNGVYTNNISYVSEGLIDLSAPRYVFLSIDDHNNSVSDGFISVYSSSILNKNILARVSVRGNVFNYMAQNNLSTTTYPREYFGPVNIQRMNIQLLDEYGRILNLHNMDYSFCLTFDVIYDF
jgi:hypothetical protein